MKKRAAFGAGLAALFILGFLINPPLFAQGGDSGLDPSYGSFDSFDPSEDFKETPRRSAPARSPAPAPAADFEVPPAEGQRSLRGAADIPDPRLYDQPETEVADYEPPAESPPVERPARTETAPAPIAPAPAVVAADPPPPPAASMSTAAAVDYSRADSWLVRPDSPDGSVDIFYVYPGLCGRAGSGGALCPAGDPSSRSRAEEITRFQAGVFEPIGNIYVPFYRQSNSIVFLGLAPQDRDSRILPSAADLAAAFDYYMRNYNKGRPFILAGHGQGSAALLKGVLGDYLRANPEARSLMVAAYILGYGVTSDYLSENAHLRFAERRDDLGVIISYSTEIPEMGGPNPVLLPRTVAINPINWSRSARKGTAAQSQGANLRLFDGEDMVKDFADARVNLKRGVVECSTVPWEEKYGAEAFPDGALPAGDYAFYYYDLRRNAQDRVDAFRRGR